MDGDNGQSPMVVIPVPPPPPAPPEPKLLIPLPSGKRRRRADHGSDHGDSHDSTGPPLVLIAVIAAIVLLLLAAGAVGFGYGPAGWGHHDAFASACPRPPMPGDTQPQFNEQQRDVRLLRRQAFRGDFFAQLELGHRYEGARPNDKNLQDQVESATWYSLALANADGYDRVGAGLGPGGLFGPRPFSVYDDCRHGEREIAYRSLNRLLAGMSTEERDKVRRRATYVLSTQGSRGFRTLGRLHDVAFGPFGEPADDIQAVFARRPDGWPDAIRLFERNGVDAYMYDYLAMQTGDEGAYVLLQDLQHNAPWAGFSDIAEQRARRWVPPYEFYPPDAPESGVPHSDESEPVDEIDRIALYRINELPFVHIAEALAYLHVIPKPCVEKELTSHDVQTFQAMIGRPSTGYLSPLERVRAIQFAAVNGSPHAQLVLAVMYAQGVGVPPDYARAFHWFEEADRQGSPEAKYAVATYFSEGLAGVADQAKAEAVVHQLDAALAGFRPSAQRLRRMLELVSPGPHRPWNGYGRPEEQFGPEDSYGDGGPGPGDGGPPPGYGPAQGYGGPPPAYIGGAPGYSSGPGPYGAAPPPDTRSQLDDEDWPGAGDTRDPRPPSARPAPPHVPAHKSEPHPKQAAAKTQSGAKPHAPATAATTVAPANGKGA
jgi:TPR repeat protein